MIVNYYLDFYLDNIDNNYHNLNSNEFVIKIDDWTVSSEDVLFSISNLFKGDIDYDMTVDILIDIMPNNGIRNGNIKKVKGKLRLRDEFETNFTDESTITVKVKPSDATIKPAIFNDEDITSGVKETLKNIQCELEYECYTD